MIRQDLLERRQLREVWEGTMFDFGVRVGVGCSLVRPDGTPEIRVALKARVADPEFDLCVLVRLVAEQINDRLLAASA